MILEKSKPELELYRMEINKFLKTIKLELHPEKSKIVPLHKGVEMLGFRVFYHYKLLKRGNIKLMRKRMDNFKKLHEYGWIQKEYVASSLQSWCAHAKWANACKLRRDVVKGAGEFLNRKPTLSAKYKNFTPSKTS